jgi:uncharacterized damage-inducible protein DinB
METARAKTYNIATGLLGELDYEITATKKCLERIPENLFDYKPHEKSMTMIQLAKHVAEMFSWVTVTCNSDQLDFATDYKPVEIATNAELVEFLDKNIADAQAALKNTSDEDMHKDWTLRNGEQIYFTMSKIATIRTFALNHIYNHRGQLTVYMRLNDIPVPSLYGPSADEGKM